jgi:DNA-directed RNA polymerase specialized sigma24 family protein
MLSPAQLHMRLLPPEAQQTAVQRLALRGWDAKTISTQTGLTEIEVDRLLDRTALDLAHVMNRRERSHATAHR